VRGGHLPNRKYRVGLTPAKRGRGRKQRQPTGDNWLDKAPAERHASMVDFCSWKTDIYPIFGKNLDAGAQVSTDQK
jgi:hypothetical protein